MKLSVGGLWLYKDMSELDLSEYCGMSFPNEKGDLLNFEINIRPDEGFHGGEDFVVSFKAPLIYPHEAPRVQMQDKNLPS